jgi:hypothetical protein
MNFLQIFNVRVPVQLQYSRYDNEKERRRLFSLAQNEVKNNPDAEVWYVDVTTDGITTGRVGES